MSSRSTNLLSPGLAIAALGAVFGDIGTSPLYAFRQCFRALGTDTSPASVTGVLSLITWSLIVVVCVKYAGVILRFDNAGHGGILALFALIRQKSPGTVRRWPIVTLMALIATGMLVGDGMITPSISVMSAVEGLDVAVAGGGRFVVPIAATILVLLFALQSRGTERIGKLFGPLVAIWFLAIGVAGAHAVLLHPSVLRALDPLAGAGFLLHHGLAGLLLMGAVVLTVTGCEALYADMSHVGRRAIVVAWYCVVLPALLLNYYGQASLVLTHPAAVAHPFYSMLPNWAIVPMLLLATLATIVASQALISGVFTISEQAMAAGYIPRLRTINTSRKFSTQVFVPSVNVALGVLCIALVFAFQNSGRLASAYGLAVSATMTITTIFFWIAATRVAKWPAWLAAALSVVFLLFDLSFLVASLPKVFAGAWLPLAVSAAIVVAGSTWMFGRRRLKLQFRNEGMPLKKFVRMLEDEPREPVAGTAVFLTDDTRTMPFASRHHLIRTHAAYERIVLLSLRWKSTPFVYHGNRVSIKQVGTRIFLVMVNIGFMERASLDVIKEACDERRLHLLDDAATFFSIDPVVTSATRGFFGYLRRKLYGIMLLIRYPLVAEIQIPADQCARLGLEVPL